MEIGIREVSCAKCIKLYARRQFDFEKIKREFNQKYLVFFFVDSSAKVIIIHYTYIRCKRDSVLLCISFVHKMPAHRVHTNPAVKSELEILFNQCNL